MERRSGQRERLNSPHAPAFLPAAACLLATTPALFAQPTLVDPGFVSGYPFMNPGGLSADGNATTGVAASFSGQVAFRWTRSGGLVSLGFIPGATFGASDGNAISADGSTIVGIGNAPGGARAFRWTQTTGMVNLGTVPGGGSSEARAVNANGSVVVGRVDTPEGPRAFRWTASDGMQSLGLLGPGFSFATGISDDGTIIVGTTTSPTGIQPFRWTASGGMVGMGIPAGASNAFAVAINSDGSVVVGFFDVLASGRHGFRWTSTGGYTDLGLEIQPLAVSGDGQVVVGLGPYGSGLWHPVTGTVDLEDYLDSLGLPTPNRRITLLDGASADGSTIAGGGFVGTYVTSPASANAVSNIQQ